MKKDSSQILEKAVGKRARMIAKDVQASGIKLGYSSLRKQASGERDAQIINGLVELVKAVRRRNGVEAAAELLEEVFLLATDDELSAARRRGLTVEEILLDRLPEHQKILISAIRRSIPKNQKKEIARQATRLIVLDCRLLERFIESGEFVEAETRILKRVLARRESGRAKNCSRRELA